MSAWREREPRVLKNLAAVVGLAAVALFGVGWVAQSSHPTLTSTTLTYSYDVGAQHARERLAGDVGIAVMSGPRRGDASVALRTGPSPVSLGLAAEEGSGLTRVGRWMSAEEHGAMTESGMVQPGRTGVSNVAHPADVEAYMRQAAPGSRYLEFDVPESSLVRGGKDGWATIPGPDSIFSRLKIQRGLAPYEFPPAQNIEWIASRLGLG